MFREYTSPAHLGSYLAGVGSAVLVVIVGWILLQTLPVAAPVSLPSGADDASISTTSSTAIHPADRKLVDEGYLAILTDREEINAPASTNLANRRLSYEDYVEAIRQRDAALTREHENPAHRRFYGGSYEDYLEAIRRRQSAR
jgi:hypothetical protein